MSQRIKTLFAGGVLALALFGAAAAGPLEDATSAYQRGDYATALRIVRPLAEQGDAGAQGSLGAFYAYGQGVPQDYALALVWYRKAAEQGDAFAQTGLGVMYANGRGVPQDDAQAVAWYRKAAEQGDAEAQGSLGAMYATGHGVPQDYVLAHMWVNLAMPGLEDATRRKVFVTLRDAVAAKMTPDQIAEAQRLARERKPK
jgi:TPR repeat protein